MRIVVDAMGSDNHPVPDVAGAVMAAREWHDDILLVGDSARINEELAKHDTQSLSLEVVHASQAISMTDKPSAASREKKDSSMHVGLNLVSSGDADAFVSAGNTGAVLAVATLHTVKRIKGVKRPALTATVPHLNGKVIAADIGANADCKPEMLAQFALMADCYVQRALGLENPRIALLSNGEEEGKGNMLIKDTSFLLQETKGMNFIGNVEPKELLLGKTDVVIQDGFTGNVLIKTMEATVKMMSALIKREIKAGALTSVGGLLAKPAFGRVAKYASEETVGGAPLLGVDGVVIIGHGSSTPTAIMNAVLRAREAVAGDVITAIRAGISGN